MLGIVIFLGVAIYGWAANSFSWRVLAVLLGLAAVFTIMSVVMVSSRTNLVMSQDEYAAAFSVAGIAYNFLVKAIAVTGWFIIGLAARRVRDWIAGRQRRA